ncbi:MAG: hypothetical protein BWY70_01363 [Bacteroidetes bacterium ADurb.Bin408]|nr:MAG: hypothetical protein BWY70_01363 [Bacteroidetes bacterium ADurb.Bin408]
MVSVEENDETTHPILFYPNPVSGNVLYFSKNVSFTLYDLLGNKLSRVINADNLNISGMAKGYYLIITDEGVGLKLLIAD